MYVHGLPATRWSFILVVTASAPGACRAWGGTPGQIGTWVCPGDGCQAGACALELPTAQATHNAVIGGFIVERRARLPARGREHAAYCRGASACWIANRTNTRFSCARACCSRALAAAPPTRAATRTALEANRGSGSAINRKATAVARALSLAASAPSPDVRMLRSSVVAVSCSSASRALGSCIRRRYEMAVNRVPSG